MQRPMSDEEATSYRVEVLEKKVTVLEERIAANDRMTFGYHDDARNQWVPGIWQKADQTYKILVIILRFCYVGVPALVAIVLHQYGIVELIGKMLEAFH